MALALTFVWTFILALAFALDLVLVVDNQLHGTDCQHKTIRSGWFGGVSNRQVMIAIRKGQPVKVCTVIEVPRVDPHVDPDKMNL